MNESKLNVLLVDDDSVLIDMHSVFLENNNYHVFVAEDGGKAVELLNVYHESIGVVVSDINMPNMDGYELCKKIKKDRSTKDIPVIFVSAYTGLEEKMKGYAVGADDYITKPVNDIELVQKISVLLDIRQQQLNLDKRAIESNDMVLQAKVYSSEISQIVEFYNRVLRAKTHDEIAEFYFETLSALGLISVLQMYTAAGVKDYGEMGIVTPLESSVIQLARDKGQYFDSGARTIVNFNNLSILVKNMPLGEHEKYERVKELLYMIGNGLEGKIAQLNLELIDNKKESVMLSIKESISSIENSFAEIKHENISAIKEMSKQLHETLILLDLTKSQQHNLQDIAQSCLKKSNAAFYKSVNISESLGNISEQLFSITGSKV